MVRGPDRPADHPGVDAAERAHITSDHELPQADPGSPGSAAGSPAPFWELLRSRYVIALAIAFFAYSWVLFMFLTWYPQYLVDARGVDRADMAALATIPWLTATVGLVAGGLVADRLVRRTGSLVAPRKWVLVVALLATAACFGSSPFLSSPGLGLVLVSGATMFLLASYQHQSLIVHVLGIWHFSFTVGDIDRSVACYGDLLGFELVHRQDQSKSSGPSGTGPEPRTSRWPSRTRSASTSGSPPRGCVSSRSPRRSPQV